MANNRNDDFWSLALFAIIVLIVIYITIEIAFVRKKIQINNLFVKTDYAQNDQLLPRNTQKSKISTIAIIESHNNGSLVQKKNTLKKAITKKDNVAPVDTKTDNIYSKNDLFYVQVMTPVLHVRSKPNVKSRIIRNFLRGVLVQVKIARKNDDGIWYVIQQQKYLRYPKRVDGSWFICGKCNGKNLVRKIETKREEITVFPRTKDSDKIIKVSLSRQKLQAFEKNKLVLSTLVSTGLRIKNYKTPIGKFKILRKKLSAYMQGPLPHDNAYFDLPGVPFTMYFTKDGAALHGTYWHHDFGHRHSHGCVNLPLDKAEWLYWWAKVGTPIIITK